jgi:hypothetical protein
LFGFDFDYAVLPYGEASFHELILAVAQQFILHNDDLRYTMRKEHMEIYWLREVVQVEPVWAILSFLVSVET